MTTHFSVDPMDSEIMVTIFSLTSSLNCTHFSLLMHCMMCLCHFKFDCISMYSRVVHQ